MPQTTGYVFPYDGRACDGQLYDLNLVRVDSHIADAAINFGTGVAYEGDFDDEGRYKSVIPASARTDEEWAGVAVRELLPGIFNGDGLAQFAANDTVGVVKKGRIYVPTVAATAVVPGTRCYIENATGKFGNSGAGFSLFPATYVSSEDANDIAIIEVDTNISAAITFVMNVLGSMGMTISGSGVPTVVAVDGMVYINTANGDLYVYDESVPEWTANGSLPFPVENLLAGDGAPADTLGNDGDYYLNVSVDPMEVYGPKAAGAWPGTGTAVDTNA